MAVLDHDFGQDALDRFGGRLYKATLHKRTPGTYDPNDPSAGSHPTIVDYTCDAIAFGYKQRFVDGERIRKGDYRVVILRTSLPDVVPEPGDRVAVPPPGGTTSIVGEVIVVEVITEAQITCQVRGAPE